MRNLLRWTSFVVAGVATAFLLAGCSQETGAADKPDKSVNVAAQIDELKRGDKDKMINACTELAKAQEYAAPATDELIAALKNPDALVRRLAAYALGRIGPKASKALPALKETMGADSDSTVVAACSNALRSIDPSSMPKIDTSDPQKSN